MFMQKKLKLEENIKTTPNNTTVTKTKLKKKINKRKQQEQQMMMQQQQMMQGSQSQLDPQIVLQQLISQGVPEEEAIAMIQSM